MCARNADKKGIAEEILKKIASLDPPGRVYEQANKDDAKGLFVVVPLSRAIEKTCQALRERKSVKPTGYDQHRKDKDPEEKSTSYGSPRTETKRQQDPAASSTTQKRRKQSTKVSVPEIVSQTNSNKAEGFDSGGGAISFYPAASFTTQKSRKQSAKVSVPEIVSQTESNKEKRFDSGGEEIPHYRGTRRQLPRKCRKDLAILQRCKETESTPIMKPQDMNLVTTTTAAVVAEKEERACHRSVDRCQNSSRIAHTTAESSGNNDRFKDLRVALSAREPQEAILFTALSDPNKDRQGQVALLYAPSASRTTAPFALSPITEQLWPTAESDVTIRYKIDHDEPSGKYHGDVDKVKEEAGGGQLMSTKFHPSSGTAQTKSTISPITTTTKTPTTAKSNGSDDRLDDMLAALPTNLAVWSSGMFSSGYDGLMHPIQHEQGLTQHDEIGGECIWAHREDSTSPNTVAMFSPILGNSELTHVPISKKGYSDPLAIQEPQPRQPITSTRGAQQGKQDDEMMNLSSLGFFNPGTPHPSPILVFGASSTHLNCFGLCPSPVYVPEPTNGSN